MDNKTAEDLKRFGDPNGLLLYEILHNVNCCKKKTTQTIFYIYYNYKYLCKKVFIM